MTLVLNGSPNKNGFTSKAVKESLKEEYTEIFAYDELIKSCDDCKSCNIKQGCKWDDMDYIYDLLSKTDKLVIASPIHFGALSSELLQIISRFQSFYAQKYYRKAPMFTIKETLLVVTAGGEYPDMFDGARATMKILNMLFESKITNEIFIKNTD